METLNKIQKELRRKLIRIAYEKQVGHIGSALSCLDLIYAIYRDNDMTKTKFVLSKGHAALAYYVVLNHFSYISDELLETFCDEGSPLYGHVSLNPDLGVECTTGSLGHGICIATGMALGDPDQNIICLVGDGETEEGSYGEARHFAEERKYEIDNLYVFVDCNRYKGYDKAPYISPGDCWPPRDQRIINTYSNVEEVPMQRTNYYKDKRFWSVQTKKGHGISFLEEGGLSSHYMKLTKELYEQAMKELK